MIQKIAKILSQIDRRVIAFFLLLSLSIPLLTGYSLSPAPMKTATTFFEEIDQLQPENGKFVLVSLDWGPSTQAENRPQTEVVIEHLMRKKIPVVVMTAYAYGAGFAKSIPQKIASELNKEGYQIEYGSSWVSLGYRPGIGIMVQGIAKSSNLSDYFKTDAEGRPLSQLKIFSQSTSIKNIQAVAEFTGLVGMLNVWLQFFQVQDYRPKLFHGCTSITIPESYIFFDSGQISGLHEGIAGAAWYEKLLEEKYALSQDTTNINSKSTLREAKKINTTLAVAHIFIIFLVCVGNIGSMLSDRIGKGE